MSFLLWGIFITKEWNPHLLLGRQILCHRASREPWITVIIDWLFSPFLQFSNLLLFLSFLNCSIIALQCYVSFCCTVKWISYMYTHIPFLQSCLTLCDSMAATHQASLSITISQSLLRLMSIESVMPSNHLILCPRLLLLPSIFPSIRVFSKESVLHHVAKVLEFQLQTQSLQWIFRTDFL